MSVKILIRCGWFLTLSWLVVQSVHAQVASMAIYVFKQGLPRSGVEVLLDEQLVGVTDENGVFRLSMESGIRYLELRDQDLVVLSQQLLVREEEDRRWIVNITPGLSALVDAESSVGAIAAPVESDPDTGPLGSLVGVLVSAEDGKPLVGARIFISGQGKDVRTDQEGRFALELPAGDYSISVLHAAHNTLSRDGLEVLPGQELALELELTPSGSELPEFVVIEPYIEGSLASVLEERRSELAVANILGAEAISRSGDSDAAGALRRVTGLTLVDGRFIYVRGLGERYSSTLLNNANVPSPDPTRRVVPLDLFPTGIVQSIAVKKGYTADLPAEFGGGAVELRTKSIPESSFLRLEFGLAYRDGTSFDKGLRYDGGASDWAGRDDGTRAPSAELAEILAGNERLRPFNRFTGEGFEPELLQEIGLSLPVNYDIYETDISPNVDAGVSGGYGWNFDNGHRFGFLTAAEYKDDWQTVRQSRTQFVVSSGDELVPQNEFDYLATLRNINLSFFLTTGYEFDDDNRVSFNWMLLRNTFDRAQIEQGNNPDAEGGDVLFRELEWIEREMRAKQLIGEHRLAVLGDLGLKWQYTDADAAADAPDTRRYRYDPDRRTENEDDFIFSLRNDSNQRRWSELADSSVSWNLDADLPLEFGDVLALTLRAGLSKVNKRRDSSIRRFSYFSEGPLGRDLDTLRLPSLEDIINGDTIAPDGWQLEEITNATDAYTGAQNVEAWHVGLDLDLGDEWRFSGGFRNEIADLVVSTFTFSDPDNALVSTQQTDDLFPFATLTWLPGSHQFRAGFGRTINRPDFKELSPSEYRDPLLDRIVRGNPDLQPAFITHYDLRWDYYFNPGEFVSLGVFQKEFASPIEIVVLASAGDQLTTFDNAQTAENFGFEFELYKTLSFLTGYLGGSPLWEKIYVNTNYAWIDSDIVLSEDSSTIQTSDNRPLQGQSPYVWNFQIGYEDPDREINAALLYNVFGERIVEVGVQGAPDIYEQPRPSLDFVYSQVLGNWKLKGKLKNLLNPQIRLTQGNEAPRVTQPVGWELSLGLEYVFR